MAWYDPRTWFKKPKEPQPAPAPQSWPIQPQTTPKTNYSPVQGPYSPVAKTSSGGGGGISSGPNQNYSPAQQTYSPVAPSPTIPNQSQTQMLPQQAGDTTTVRNKMGTYKNVGPNQSYHDITGKYEYDFFTLEGQQERLKNVLDVTSIVGQPWNKEQIVDASGQPVDALNSPITRSVILGGEIANFANLARSVGSTLMQWNKIGNVASAPGGAEALSSATGPTLKGTAGLGKWAINSKNVATAINAIKGVMTTSLPARNTAAGFLIKYGGIGAVIGTGYNIQQGKVIQDEYLDYIDDSHELIQKYQDLGMPEAAEEIVQQNKDIEQGLKEISPLIPYLSPSLKKEKIREFVSKLHDENLAYDKAAADKKIADKAAEDKQAEIDKQRVLDDKREYDELLKEADRRYNEERMLEQRAYDEKLTQEQRDYAYQKLQEQRAYDASNQPAPEVYSPSSTLNFGLLHTPGGSESVNTGAAGTGAATTGAATTGTATATGDTATAGTGKDAIAMYLFGKSYAELTPEQKAVVDKW